MKKIIRLTENELHNYIKNTVKKIINEGYENVEYTLKNFSSSILEDIKSLNLKRNGFINISGETILQLIPQGVSQDVTNRFGFSNAPLNNVYLGLSFDGKTFFIHCIDSNYNKDVCEPIPYSVSNLYSAYGEIEKYEDGEMANPSYSDYHSDFYSDAPELTPDYNKNIRDNRYNAERYVNKKNKY